MFWHFLGSSCRHPASIGRRGRRQRRLRHPPRSKRRRLVCEGLEQRMLLAHIVVDWNGGVGSWNVAANWTPNVVPCNSATDTYSVLIDGSEVGAASEVNLDISCSVNGVTIDASETLNILNSRSLTVASGGYQEDVAWQARVSV